MFLADDDIIRELEFGRLAFDGRFRGDALLLTVGGPVSRPSATQQSVPIRIHHANAGSVFGPAMAAWDDLIIAPGEFVLAQARERLYLSTGLIGLISTLSHVARYGLSATANSFVVEGDFEGHLTLELVNHAPFPIHLRPGDAVAKVKVALACEGRLGKQFYGRPGELHSRLCDEAWLSAEGCNV